MWFNGRHLNIYIIVLFDVTPCSLMDRHVSEDRYISEEPDATVFRENI
jgi:hypothetical protein